MNILITLNSSRPGGMEFHVLDLVRGLSARGHKVHVWCPAGTMSDLYKGAGAVLVVTKINLDVDFPYIAALKKYVKDQKIDLIHAHELKAVGNALIAKMVLDVPVVTHIHTPLSEWQIDSFRKGIYTYAYSLATRYLTSVEIALTESRKIVKMREGFGAPAEKFEIIPNCVDFERFALTAHKRAEFQNEIRQKYNIPNEAYVFGNISRISAEKGHFILLEAFKQLLVSRTFDVPVYLFIAGGGSLQQDFETKVEEFGLKGRVVVTGIFEEDDKPKFLASFDSFVFPTLAEGFGIVLLEAMSASLPTICSNLEVLQEVGGSTVFFFETNDSGSLADKMWNVYSRRASLDSMGESALNRVKELYSFDNFINLYEDLYFRLLEARK